MKIPVTWMLTDKSFFCRLRTAFSLLLFGLCCGELTSSLAISLVEYCVLAHCFQSPFHL